MSKTFQELEQQPDKGEENIQIHTDIEMGFCPTFRRYRKHKAIMKDVLNHLLEILEND